MNVDALRIIEPPTLVREQAFERLRDAIITGHFAPGHRLIERELCEAMGVSRTSIREVLRRLEAERLVKVEPRKGPVVASVTAKQAAEIYEMRAHLEAILLRRFTEKATDAEVKKLRAIFNEVPAAAEAEDIPRLISIMMRFNDHITQVVDHEIISDILKQLIARISFLRGLSMSQPGRIRQSVGEIRKVVEAVERRDSDGAAQSVSEYIQNAAAAALRRLEKGLQADN